MSYTPKQVYCRLLAQVKPYWPAFMLAMLGNVLYAIVDGAMIKFLQPLVDEGFVKQNQNFIHVIPAIIVGIFIFRGIASFLSSYCMGWVARNVIMNLRQRVFHKVLRLPARYFDKTTSGEVLSKIIYDVEQVANASSDSLTILVREGCTVLALSALMIYTSWRMVFLFVIMAPVLVTCFYWVSKRVRKVSTRVQHSMGHVMHVAEEAIEGQKVIKAFGGQTYERQSFNKATAYNRKQELKVILTEALCVPGIQFIGAIALAVTIFFAIGTMTPGAFAMMMTSMITILKPIKQLTKINTSIQRGIAGATSVFTFLDLEEEPETGTQELVDPQGAIAFHEVSFAYENNLVLDKVSFEVKPGETLAIVGRSGGGKSTLVNLLPRFYEGSGLISLDGLDIKSLTLKNLRQHIAVVTQQVTLFNDTIIRNIAYGEENPDIEAVKRAAESAYAKDFIEALPDGFNTVIGENGVRLSGGQRQRLSIARAIYKAAPILILDEATSALDTESERYIQKALDSLMAKTTTLVIAHRLSTIEKADKILVLEQGKVVETGCHHTLISQAGLYAKLRQMQMQVEQSPQEVQVLDA